MATASVEGTGLAYNMAPLAVPSARTTEPYRQPWLVTEPHTGTGGFTRERARELTETAATTADQSAMDLAQSPEIIAILDQVVQKWGLQDHDAAGLLGVSDVEWQQLKSNAAQLRSGQPPTSNNPQSLSNEQLERIGILVHMLMTLHSMCGEEIADNWANSPNQNPIFGGATPAAAMIAGGLPKMREARDYLDEAALF